MTKLAISITLLCAGCAMDAGDASEGTVASAVTEHTTNYVTSCANLALRTCDNPGGCDTGIRMPFGTRLEIGDVDWNTRMARVTSSPYGSGWALSSLNGEPYISAAVPSHCE